MKFIYEGTITMLDTIEADDPQSALRMLHVKYPALKVTSIYPAPTGKGRHRINEGIDLKKIEDEAKIIVTQVSDKKLPLYDLHDGQLFILLAWELWHDGLDVVDEIISIAEGQNPLYNTREKCIHPLVTVFGYF